MSKIFFFIVVDDPYVKHGLGIIGNEQFGKVMLLYVADTDKGSIELIGVEEYSEEKATVYKWFGFRDFTPVFERLYGGRKPRELNLFEIDITDVLADIRLKKFLEKLQ